ncbi:MAG: nicotinate (nicotinamide) nucleotide adenylyltransferase, partial [Prevotella sp.]|nr:nicotinate (nicotinamide) nucleotide adenylyltransferase [Prevotella sp.]
MKIAMFGGSFNPVHNGHLMLASAALDKTGCDSVLFVPTYQSPFKNRRQCAADSDRTNMIRLAIEKYPRFRLEICELERGGVSYTIDTVRYLEQKYGSRISLIVGDDLLHDFLLWKDAEKILELADIIVGSRIRGKSPQSGERTNYRFRYTELGNEVFPVSSSEIRKLIALGDSSVDLWKNLVPPDV